MGAFGPPSFLQVIVVIVAADNAACTQVVVPVVVPVGLSRIKMQIQQARCTLRVVLADVLAVRLVGGSLPPGVRLKNLAGITRAGADGRRSVLDFAARFLVNELEKAHAFLIVNRELLAVSMVLR